MSGLDSVPYRYRVGSIIPPSRSGFSGLYILTTSCLSDRQGFILHSVTRLHRPCVFSTIRESATFCALPRFGFAYSVRFYDTFGNNRYQHRKASLGKTHYLPICRPTSLRFGSPDIRPRSHTPARPPPRCHIVGSLFATYTGSASCFLRTHHFWKLPLPCRRRPSVR